MGSFGSCDSTFPDRYGSGQVTIALILCAGVNIVERRM